MTLALWHITPETSELRPTPEPAVAERHGLVKVNSLFSLISKGTERLVASGNADPQFEKQMAVPYMEGSFSLPVKYGYSIIGETEDKNLVHLLHPHQQQVWVSSESLFYLPENVSPQRMTLISNMETIINACWDAEYFCERWQDKTTPVVVCGFGAIGSLLAITLRKIGFVNVQINEIESEKCKLANSLDFKLISKDECLAYSLMFHTTSSPQGLQWCIDNSQQEATIFELSWYGKKACQLLLGGDFHFKRLRLISSQVSTIPGHKPDETYQTRKSYAVELLMDDIYQSLLDKAVPFEQAPRFFETLRNNTNTSPLQSTFSYLSD